MQNPGHHTRFEFPICSRVLTLLRGKGELCEEIETYLLRRNTGFFLTAALHFNHMMNSIQSSTGHFIFQFDSRYWKPVLRHSSALYQKKKDNSHSVALYQCWKLGLQLLLMSFPYIFRNFTGIDINFKVLSVQCNPTIFLPTMQPRALHLLSSLRRWSIYERLSTFLLEFIGSCLE